MKVITILQPYATLIALGAKKIETRNWKPEYFGPLLIHAGKGTGMLRQCYDEPIHSLLRRYRISRFDQFPMGHAIAVAQLTSCSRSEVVAKSLTPQERALGNYQPHRWGWQFGRVRRLKHPIPISGKQGLWDWDPPAGFQWTFLDPEREETAQECDARTEKTMRELQRESQKFQATDDRREA